MMMMNRAKNDDVVKRLTSFDVMEIKNIKSNLQEEIKSMYKVPNDVSGQQMASYPFHHQHHQDPHSAIMPSHYNSNQVGVNSAYYMSQSSATDTPDLTLPDDQVQIQFKQPKQEAQYLGLEQLFNENVNHNTQPNSYLDYDNHEIDETALQNFIKFEESLENLNASLSSYKTSSYQQEQQFDKQAVNPFQQQIDNLFVLDEDEETHIGSSRYGDDERNGKLGSYHYWHRLNASKLEQNEF